MSQFTRSPQLAKILNYVVSEELAGRGEALKAYSIGVDCLGRSKNFDPANDSTVRVEMLRLRRALETARLSRPGERHLALAVGSYRPFVIDDSLDAADPPIADVVPPPTTPRVEPDPSASPGPAALPTSHALPVRTIGLIAAGLLLTTGVSYAAFRHFNALPDAEVCATRPQIAIEVLDPDNAAPADAQHRAAAIKTALVAAFRGLPLASVSSDRQCRDVPSYTLQVQPSFSPGLGQSGEVTTLVAKLIGASEGDISFGPITGPTNLGLASDEMAAGRLAYLVGSPAGVVPIDATARANQWRSRDALELYKCNTAIRLASIAWDWDNARAQLPCLKRGAARFPAEADLPAIIGYVETRAASENTEVKANKVSSDAARLVQSQGIAGTNPDAAMFELYQHHLAGTERTVHRGVALKAETAFPMTPQVISQLASTYSLELGEMDHAEQLMQRAAYFGGERPGFNHVRLTIALSRGDAAGALAAARAIFPTRQASSLIRILAAAQLGNDAGLRREVIAALSQQGISDATQASAAMMRIPVETRLARTISTLVTQAYAAARTGV